MEVKLHQTQSGKKKRYAHFQLLMTRAYNVRDLVEVLKLSTTLVHIWPIARPKSLAKLDANAGRSQNERITLQLPFLHACDKHESLRYLVCTLCKSLLF